MGGSRSLHRARRAANLRRAYVPKGRQAQPSRVLTAPEAGYYRVRLPGGTVWVAARIHYEPTRDPETDEPLDRSWYYSADVDQMRPDTPSPLPTRRVTWIWTSGERIIETEYRYLIETAAWERQHAPDGAMANPKMAVDLMTQRVPF